MVHILYFSKIVFLFSLIGICFIVFGLGFFKKFLACETTVNESTEQKQALKPPAITICPQVGWKNSNSRTARFRTHCKNASRAEEFWKCLEDKTYNFSEIVLSAFHGHPMNLVNNITDEQKFWSWSTPAKAHGRCYTLLYDQPLQIDMTTHIILINLKAPSRHYFVYLHDPDFFFMTYNPFTMPMTEVHLNPEELNSSHLLLPMAVVKTTKLNRPEMPCNPSPKYSFTTCVKQSLARMTNCSLPWDPLDQGFRKCKFL